jgi:hypothetical protein
MTNYRGKKKAIEIRYFSDPKKYIKKQNPKKNPNLHNDQEASDLSQNSAKKIEAGKAKNFDYKQEIRKFKLEAQNFKGHKKANPAGAAKVRGDRIASAENMKNKSSKLAKRPMDSNPNKTGGADRKVFSELAFGGFLESNFGVGFADP